ncbi:MAG: VWA domain-containing protein [Minicystis sp.]
MNRFWYGLVVASTLTTACAPAPLVVQPVAANDAPSTQAAADPTPASAAELAARASDQPVRPSGAWIGAAGESDFVLAGTSDTALGVWVDVPTGLQKARAPADVAVVIDTSGSMAGAKIENARIAAQRLVDKLADGDIVSLITFANNAEERVSPTTLNAGSRQSIRNVIDGLVPQGGTNMFDGLRWAEGRVSNGPQTHPVRRIVMISDGQANVGPSSPEVLGALAARGADAGVQVSAIGVGLDYDEHTLNALAMQSSGRLYHLDEPRELASILEREIGLLQTTAATAAAIEVMPAPGVQILSADGVRYDAMANGAVQIPLGTMFAGQHREMLIRVRVHATGEGTRPLASVRLRFRDPADGGLERVQETVARYQVTSDRRLVEAHANEKTRTIVATQQAAQITIEAAQQLNDGRYAAADQQLAQAETKLKEAAAHAKSESDRQRVMATVQSISKARAAAKADAAAPPAARPAPRSRALDVNQAGMRAYGY